MPDPPDLLAHGDEREPRQVPRRILAAGTVVVVLVGAGLVGGRAASRDRAEQRAADAEFVVSDAVQLVADLQAFNGSEPGAARIETSIEVTRDREPAAPGRVTDVSIEGAGLRPVPYGTAAFSSFPLTLSATADVDCTDVGQQVPTEAAVVVTVTPVSGVPHLQRLPVPAQLLREAVLQACDLPDPAARTVLEASAQNGRLIMFVESVPRSKGDLVIGPVSVPGFRVSPDQFTLPYAVPSGTGLVFGLRVSVVDCGAARAGGLKIRATLTQAGATAVQEAGPSVSQPQPGAIPAQAFLTSLVDARCP